MPKMNKRQPREISNWKNTRR